MLLHNCPNVKHRAAQGRGQWMHRPTRCCLPCTGTTSVQHGLQGAMRHYKYCRRENGTCFSGALESMIGCDDIHIGAQHSFSRIQSRISCFLSHHSRTGVHTVELKVLITIKPFKVAAVAVVGFRTRTPV
jgi:hypothetical protein